MTLEEIDGAISALERARTDRLLGQQVASTSYPATGTASFAAASVAEISREIARLKIERSRLTGEASGFGPIVPGFGCRP